MTKSEYTKRRISILLSISVIGLMVSLVLVGARTLGIDLFGDPASKQNQVILSPESADDATFPSSKMAREYTFRATQDGQTAFELLDADTDIVSKDFEFGMFIESINGLAGDTNNFWALYINGEFASQSADKTVLKTGDEVTFKYEEVKPF